MEEMHKISHSRTSLNFLHFFSARQPNLSPSQLLPISLQLNLISLSLDAAPPFEPCSPTDPLPPTLAAKRPPPSFVSASQPSQQRSPVVDRGSPRSLLTKQPSSSHFSISSFHMSKTSPTILGVEVDPTNNRLLFLSLTATPAPPTFPHLRFMDLGPATALAASHQVNKPAKLPLHVDESSPFLFPIRPAVSTTASPLHLPTTTTKTPANSPICFNRVVDPPAPFRPLPKQRSPA